MSPDTLAMACHVELIITRSIYFNVALTELSDQFIQLLFFPLNS